MRSVESAIYFPPFNSREMKFDWSGKELRIRILTPLKKDRTYILTIGAVAQDNRGNNLGKALNLVFATGSHIDTGSVSGRIYSSKARAYTVAAYPVAEGMDTLRPSIDLAKYVTQSDDSGSFDMSGLAVGKYRLICFDDQMKNFTYAPQMDGYASATHDVDITDSDQSVGDVNFMPGTEDTSRPRLYNAAVARDGSVLLKFSEPVDSASVSPSCFLVSDSVTSENLPVDYAVRREDNRAQVVLALTKPVTLKHTYLVTAKENVTDLQSNGMSPEGNTAAMKADTSGPELSPYYFNFSDSLQNVTTYDSLFGQFIYPPIFHATSGAVYVSLRDSSGTVVPEGILRESATVFRVSLEHLQSLKWYAIEFKYPVAGLQRDSIVSRHLRMVDFSSLGSIEGESAPSSKKIIVVAVKEDGKRFFTFAGPDGKFQLDGILPGTYTLSAYAQHDMSLNYFSGKSYPLKFAEPFGFFTDQVRVRARWTSEGVRIRLL